MKSWESEDNKTHAMEIANTFDVCVFSGTESFQFERERLKKGLLTFDMGERMMKKGIINLLSPRSIETLWNYFFRFKKSNLYKLCCSAFGPNDLYKLRMYRGRCFKWGYFPVTASYSNVEDLLKSKIVELKQPQGISILWVGRLIGWKHPEIAVELAKRIKDANFKFEMNIIGGGPLYSSLCMLVKEFGLEDCVHLLNVQNQSIVLSYMKQAQIFLFTSDKNEGWGAVLNESMSSGCVAVASDVIGSVPYLIKDKINGMIFKSEDVNSLYDNVRFLIENCKITEDMGRQAYNDIQELWSPTVAASRFVILCENLLCDTSMRNVFSLYSDGPCSKAEPIIV